MKDSAIYERNVIGKKTSITGDIVSEGDFRIDGVVEGSIKAKGKVIIGKEGKVQGEIECSTAEIEGEVSGSLLVNNMLSLKSTAVVSGDVIIGKLTVEPGAAFNAVCSMKGMIKELNNESKASKEKTA
ncbi:polymer-forming cytoskeletal protein [Bacteroidota bacterium]